MMRSKWFMPGAAFVVIVGILWYSGAFANIATGDDQAAAAVVAMKVTTVATAIQKTVADITSASGNKDAKALENIKPEYASAVSVIAELVPHLQKRINVALSQNKSVGAAQASLSDLTSKLSYLQSSALTMQNAKIDITNFNAIYDDISSIQSTLQKK